MSKQVRLLSISVFFVALVCLAWWLFPHKTVRSIPANESSPVHEVRAIESSLPSPSEQPATAEPQIDHEKIGSQDAIPAPDVDAAFDGDGTASVEGSIIEAATRVPVEGAAVCIMFKPSPDETTSTTIHSENGKFRFSQLSAGKYAVDAQGSNSVWDAKGRISSDWVLADSAVEFVLEDGQKKVLEPIMVVHGGSISGHIFDANTRQPVKGVNVRLNARGLDFLSYQSSESDETGRYVVNGLKDGSFNVSPEANETYAPVTLYDSILVTVTVGKETAGVDLYVSAGKAVLGIVLNGNVPVADAEVFALAKDNSSLDRSGRSRPDGMFEMLNLSEATEYDLVARKDSTVSSPVSVHVVEASQDDRIELRLQLSATIEGRVVDVSNSPLPNCDVVVVSEAATGKRNANYGTLTAEDGTFAVVGLFPGTYMVFATKPSDSPGNVSHSVTTEATLDEIKKEFSKQLGGPLPREAEEQLQTLVANLPKEQEQNPYRFHAVPVALDESSQETRLTVESGQKISDIILRIGRGASNDGPGSNGSLSIRGRVVDSHGDGVAEASISVISFEQDGRTVRYPVTQATSDSDGGFVVAGLAQGAYTVSANHNDYQYGDVDANAGGGVVEIRLKRLGTVRGKVLDARTGIAITKFEVGHKRGQKRDNGFLETVENTEGWLEMDPSEPTDFTYIRNEEGLFELLGIEPGPVCIFVRALGYMATFTNITMPDGGTVDGIILSLLPANTITGTVRNTTGQAIVGARVKLVEGYPSEGLLSGGIDQYAGAVAYTDDSGAFTISRTTPDAALLFVIVPDYAACGVVVPETEDSVNIVLEPGGFIEGVISADGLPVEGADVCVRARAPGATQSEGKSEANGHYRLGPLISGTYSIWAYDTDESFRGYFARTDLDVHSDAVTLQDLQLQSPNDQLREQSTDGSNPVEATDTANVGVDESQSTNKDRASH